MLVDFVQNFGNQILLKANLSDSITYFPFALVKCDFEKYREAFSLIAFHEKLGSRNTDRTAKYTNVNEIMAIPPEIQVLNLTANPNITVRPNAMRLVMRRMMRVLWAVYYDDAIK